MKKLRYIKFGDVLQQHPKEAQLIAQIIARWNEIEHDCTLLLSEFLFNNWTNASRIFGALNNSRGRVDILIQVGRARLKEKPALLEFEGAIAEVNKALEIRNSLAHGIFGEDQDGRITISNIRVSKSAGQSVFVTAADLKAKKAQMDSAVSAIMNAVSAVSMRKKPKPLEKSAKRAK